MAEQVAEGHAAPLGVAKRYASLRTIASVLRALGWIVAVLGSIAVIAAAIGSKEGGRALLVLIGGGLYVAFSTLWLFAGAAIIHLMIDMEENTRLTARLLSGRTDG